MRLSPLLVTALLAACAGAPPTPSPPAPFTAPVAAPPPARWLGIGGVTMIGPPVQGGTLVLVGGRRAIVAPDGSVREETAPSPQPLLGVVEVPTGHGPRLVALSRSAIFRLDDPLGEPKLLAVLDRDTNGKRLGAGPGYAAVWKEGMWRAASFVDVETGEPSLGPPGPLVSAMAFRTTREGAAIFAPSGLAVTRDGGATWRPVVTGGARGERPFEVEVSGGVIRLVTDTGARADLDVAAAAIGPSAERKLPADAPALLRWIEAAHEDPRAAAVRDGIPFREGEALVARYGLIARVDLATGAVTELADHPSDPRRGWCWPARTGETLWLGCGEPGHASLAVYALDAGARKIALRGPIVTGDVRAGGNDQRAARSSSGGVAFRMPCRAGEQGWCTLQPDGAWRSVDVPRDPWTAALADGRLAYVPDPYGYRDKGMHVVVAAAPRESHDLPSIPFPPPSPDDTMASYELVGSSMDEGPDHVLRFLVVQGGHRHAVHVVAQPLDGRPAQIQTLDGAAGGMLRWGRGLVFFDDGRASVSVDGGVTWTGVALPANDRWSVWVREGPLDEIGLHWGDHIRVGWGAGDPSAPPLEPPLEDRRPVDAPADAQKGTLVCAAGGRAAGLEHGLRENRSDGKRAPGRGRRETHAALRGEASFEASGPDEKSAAPARWTLRWFDPLEVGARVRSWTGKPPEGAGWGLGEVWFAFASGDEALFRIGGAGAPTSEDWLVRVTPAGAIFAHPPPSSGGGAWAFAPLRHVAPAVWIEPIASTKESGAIADDRRELVVWAKGEAPRVVARLFQRYDSVEYLLGDPGPASAPLMVLDRRLRRAAIRAVSLAAPPAGEPPYVPLDGWTQTDAPQHLGALPSCGAGPGRVFDMSFGAEARPLDAWGLGGPSLRASFGGELDGAPIDLPAGTVRVRFTGASACIETLAGAVRGRDGARDGFVRVDLERARGEVRAPAAKPIEDPMRAVTCAIGAAPAGGR